MVAGSSDPSLHKSPLHSVHIDFGLVQMCLWFTKGYSQTENHSKAARAPAGLGKASRSGGILS